MRAVVFLQIGIKNRIGVNFSKSLIGLKGRPLFSKAPREFEFIWGICRSLIAGIRGEKGAGWKYGHLLPATS